MKAKRRKVIIQLAIWTWTWVATLAIATFGPNYLWEDRIILTICAVLLNLLNGGLMIHANRNLFNHYDELERKIHLESMGFTLGGSVVFGISYALVDQLDLIHSDAKIGILVFFIGITYMISLLINRKRYL